MKLADIQVDAERERTGVWREYLDTGFECLIARAGNEDVVAHRRKLEREYRQGKGMQPGEPIPEEDDIEIGKRCAGRFIVRDWRGLTDESPDGDVDVPYSPEKAVEFLRDPRMRKWRDWVLRCASEDAVYEKAREKRIAGN